MSSGSAYTPYMSQANSSRCTTPTPAPFDKSLWAYQAHSLQESLVTASLATLLYGVFTILCSASIYSLTQRSDNIRIPSIALSLTLVALFASTTTYSVYTLLRTRSSILNDFLFSPNLLWRIPYGSLEIPGPELFKDYTVAQQCAGTTALTINILLGDVIVCWRTCVLWHKNRIVNCICVAFLVATFVDIRYTCDFLDNGVLDPHAVGTGSLYSGVSSGVAASVLSFSTNLGTTLLVGYKTWISRRFVRKHVIAGSLGRQTERVLALLVESGALYCALWAAVVAWQIGEYQKSIAIDTGTNTFWDIFGVLVGGALVPLIAIYPTIIIILVALNRSQVEHGFERDDEPRFPNPTRLPLRTLTVTTGSVAAEQDDDTHGAVLRGIEPCPIDNTGAILVHPFSGQETTTGTASKLVQDITLQNTPLSLGLRPLTSHIHGRDVSGEPTTH